MIDWLFDWAFFIMTISILSVTVFALVDHIRRDDE